jgi:hypothetical protein
MKLSAKGRGLLQAYKKVSLQGAVCGNYMVLKVVMVVTDGATTQLYNPV